MIARYRPAQKWHWLGGIVVVLTGLFALTDAQSQPGSSEDPDKKPDTLALTVLHLETGDPLAKARVTVSMTQDSGKQRTVEHTTDSEGGCKIRFERDSLQQAEIRAAKEGYLPLTASWKDQEVKLIPSEHTFRLSRGVEIGGKVANTAGDPVSDAKVYVNERRGLILTKQHAKWHLEGGKLLAVTDAKGHWSARALWPDYSIIHLRIRHPDYADGVFAADEPHRLAAHETPVPMEKLKQRKAVINLDQGIQLMGEVRGHGRIPVPDADVTYVQGQHAMDQLRTKTDKTGHFLFEHLPKDDGHLLIQAQGHAPAIQLIEPTQIDAVTKTIEIELPPARQLKGSVVNPDGEPIPGVKVTVDDWTNWKGLDWSTRTDSKGQFTWNSAPSDEVRLLLEKEGFVRNKETVKAGRPNRLVLQRELKLSGKVVDAKTGEPIDDFRILWTDEEPNDGRARYASLSGRFRYDRRYSRQGSGGTYNLNLGKLTNDVFADGYYHELAFRIEAIGYKPFVSRMFKLQEGDEGNITYDVELEPHNKGPIEGIVLGPDGGSLEGAQVALITPNAMVGLGENRKFDETYNSILTTSDEEGHFTLFRDPQTDFLTAVHESGFAKIPLQKFEKTRKIQLQRWGRVEGVVKSGNQALPHETVTIDTPPSEHSSSVREVQTDSNGRFALENMPPGRSSIHRMIEMDGGAASAPRKYFAVRPGETAHVTYGGGGRTVIGKLEAPHAVIDIDWKQGFHRIVSKRPEPPESIDTREEHLKWRKQPEIQKAFENIKRYPLIFSEDGSFRAVDVQPGRYRFSVRIKDPGQRRIGASTIGSFNQEFTVPEPPPGTAHKPVDLGTLQVELEGPTVGEKTTAPDFSVQGLDGSKVRLKDFRGKFVLLDFWATWCGPCIEQLPHLRKTYKQYGDNPSFALVSLSLDRNLDTVNKFVQKNELSWTHGFLGDWDQAELPDKYGVGGIPATFLIGPDGKIVSKDIRGQAIYNRVGEVLEDTAN